MKLGTILFKQHIGRHFKKHWLVQSKRKILKTAAEETISKAGVFIHDIKDIANGQRTFEKIEIIGYKPKLEKFDESHPNWHNEPLLTYKNDNVLLEGLKQAQVLTKTVLSADVPDKYVLSSMNHLEKDLNKRIKNIILSSHVFDAEQEKLPKRKDPERPAWNFPRDYGITYQRRNKLLISKLLQLLEINESKEDRYILNDLFFSYPFKKDDYPIQFEVSCDNVIVSSNPLSPLLEHQTTEKGELPNLNPLKCTISLNEENIFELRNVFPIKEGIRISHPHTIFLHYDKSKVKNLYEEEVTDEQIHGISLLKTFTVAASYARHKFGETVKDLPVPVTLQCVQTDGQWFQFGVLQLNTLNLDEDGLHNVWFQTDMMPLFQVCHIEGGKHVLRGYNEDVVKNLINFHNMK